MRNFLLLLFLYIVWGTTFTAISLALKGFTPFAMASMRFLLCGLILLPFTKREDWNFKVAWPHMLGGICLNFSNSIVVWSQQTMPSGLAALFVGTVPLWFMLLNWAAFEKKRPTNLSFVGLILGLAGVGYLSLSSGKNMTMQASGLLLIVGSLIWCLGSLVIKKSKSNHSIFASISIQSITGGTFLIIPTLINGESFYHNIFEQSLSPALGLLYLLIFGSIFAMNAYNKLLKSLSPHVVGTYALINPLVAMALGQFYLGEALTTEMCISAGLVLGGVGVIIFSNYWTARPIEARIRKF